VDKKKQTVDRHDIEVSLGLFRRVFTAKDPSKPVKRIKKRFMLSRLKGMHKFQALKHIVDMLVLKRIQLSNYINIF
jgi:hypothetical protein